MENFEENLQTCPNEDAEDLPQAAAAVSEETVTVPPEELPAEAEPAEAEAPADAGDAPEIKPKKRRKTGKVLLALLVALCLVAGSCCATAVFCYSRLAAQEKRTEQLLSQLNTQIQTLEDELSAKSFTGNGNSISGTANTTDDGTMTPGQVYAQVADSVVAITSKVTVTSGTQTTTGTSYGTGFVLTEDGYIVTNYHVVENATSVTITTHDGEDLPAELCGYDSTNDIAVLKAEAQGLQAAVIGSSDDLIVGDQVVVIGNPLGDLTATLTVGYISGKDRVISTDGSLINMLQTDAAVNSGNSGGPIFNMNGEVVGIITAKYSGTTSSGATIEGIGFAIPIDDVARKISDLKEYGYVTGAYLGVMVQDMNQTVAEYYGLPMGAYVSDVTDGYCAKAAGVQAKDIIVALGDHTITSLNDLTRALQDYEAGDVTTITVWRSGLELVLDITLDAKPQS